MRRYDSYKDSGVEWLGDVPSHWELKRLKQLFVEKKHKQNLSLNCGAISFGKVIEKDDDKVTEATKRSYQEVLKGEFLINPLNLNYDLISLRIALSEIDVVVSAGYIVLKAKQIINKKYFSYLLHRYDVAYMKLLGSGVRQTINYGHISDSILVAPPLSEQQKIAQFLDDKTAKIDQAVDLAEKQIALLKEHKQILIQNAVTRGLNPDVPLKDSGVEWIGQVPEHWEVKKITHIFPNIGSGTTPNSSDPSFYEGNINWLQTGDLTDGYIYKTSKTITHKALQAYSTLKIYPKNSLVIAMYGATIGKVGLLQIETTTNQACCVLSTALNIEMKYVFYLFQGIKESLVAMSYGGGQPNISQEKIKSLKLPFPNASEQEQIADYLDKQTAKIDQAIALKTAHIEKLKEYKSVLIDYAVTGKVRVSV